jgi:hypothetical protein
LESFEAESLKSNWFSIERRMEKVEQRKNQVFKQFNQFQGCSWRVEQAFFRFLHVPNYAKDKGNSATPLTMTPTAMSFFNCSVYQER